MTQSLDPAFLIDISAEDDSLLPPGGRSAHQGSHVSVALASANKVPEDVDSSVEAVCASILELPSCLPVSGGMAEQEADCPLPVLTKELPLAKKKKKAGFNVRKSLAWNNAFLTEEGVLDCEELSLVNKAFPKPPSIPKQSSLKKSTFTSKPLKPPVMANAPSQNAVESREKHSITALSNSRSCTGSITGTGPIISEQQINGIKRQNETCHRVNVPAALSNEQMPTFTKEKAPVYSHTKASESKPPLPRTSFDKKSDSLVPRTSFDKKSSLLSGGKGNKKEGSSVIKEDLVERAATASDYVTKKAGLAANTDASGRCSPIEATRDSFSSTTSSQLQVRPAPARFYSATATSKAHCTTKKPSPSKGSGAFSNKPSGLRMPSPKLGFFDTSRSTSQVTVLRESTNGPGMNVSGFGKGALVNKVDAEIDGLRIGSKQSNELTRPSAVVRSENVETSRNQTQGNVSGIPLAPHVTGHARSITPISSSGLSRPSLNPSNRKAENTGQALHTKKLGTIASIQGQAAVSQPVASLTRNVFGQENLSPNCNGGEAVQPKFMVSQAGKLCVLEPGKVCQNSPGKMSATLATSCTSCIPATAQSPEVSLHDISKKFTVNESQNTGEHENGHACLGIEDWPREKSGVVQNSPPNKGSPEHGPWSPVRKTTARAI